MERFLVTTRRMIDGLWVKNILLGMGANLKEWTHRELHDFERRKNLGYAVLVDRRV